jgi:hypothetical protein
VKTLSTFSRRRAGEHRAMPCVLDALWMAWANPKATILGRVARLRSSGSLWPWARVRRGEIVKFSNF